MTKEQIYHLEHLSAGGHVALEALEYDGWELRFTEGFTGRANSVQIKKASTIALSEKVEFCEKAYSDHGLPCIFKLTDADREFITFLEARGYHVTKPTDVMTLELNDARTSFDSDSVLEGVLSGSSPDGWFEPYFEFEGLTDPAKQDLTRRIHEKVSVQKLYITILHDGVPAAVASLANEDGCSLLHNVVVAPHLRGLGLGRKLCQASILKAKACGASLMYLQVMQNNPIAMNLYNSLGFEKQYTYYYVTNE